MAERWNVLLITADQLRADALGCMDHPLVRTPRLDALAAEGALFRRHYANCVPCGPSRASLMTGMYLMNHRSVQNGTPLDGRFTNLALEARRLGYDPHLIGYTDTTPDPRDLPPGDPRAAHYEGILPGFVQYAPGSERGELDLDWRRHLRDRGYDLPLSGYGAYAQAALPETAGKGPSWAPALYRAEDSDTAYTADRALRFLRQHQGEPWFLHVSFLRPHPPWVAPAPYHDLYRAEDVPDARCLPAREAETALHPFWAMRLERAKDAPDGHPDTGLGWRQARATYLGLVTELDHHVGRILDALRELGEADRTLVVFTSDHGEQLGDHWFFGKETPFDASVHVPLIVRMPRGHGRAGTVLDAFTEHVDLMPTLIELLGGEPPLQCDGRSLAPLLGGEVPEGWRRDVFWEYDFRNVDDPSIERRLGLRLDECSLAVVRGERWKYVHFAGLKPLLFDMEADRGELIDRAADPALAPVMLDCAQRLLSWRLAMAPRQLAGLRAMDGQLAEAERGRRIR